MSERPFEEVRIEGAVSEFINAFHVVGEERAADLLRYVLNTASQETRERTLYALFSFANHVKHR
jgi:hypothetical protein